MAQPLGLSADITPVSLTMTADDATRYEGQANPVFTAQYNSFISGEDQTQLSNIAITTLADASSSAGGYAITPSATAMNYAITFVDGLLTVTASSSPGGGGNGSSTPPPVVISPDGGQTGGGGIPTGGGTGGGSGGTVQEPGLHMPDTVLAVSQDPMVAYHYFAGTGKSTMLEDYSSFEDNDLYTSEPSMRLISYDDNETQIDPSANINYATNDEQEKDALKHTAFTEIPGLLNIDPAVAKKLGLHEKMF